MTQYEWDVEEIDEHGDIIDHNHRDTAVAVLHLARGFALSDVVLVRDVWKDDSLQERSWAYVVDGRLPEFFEDAYQRQTVKVPARFHSELKAATLGT